MDKFNLHTEYKKYLKRVGLEEGRMHRIQRIETKRAFVAGFGQMVILLRDDLPDNEDEAVAVLDSLINQVNVFWAAESKK